VLIAILEDDESIAELMKAWLSAAGYRVAHHASGAAFRKATAARTPDLAIVDRMLPDDDGVEIVKWFRAEVDPVAPVLFASALGAEQDIVAALDAGADDYFVKPLRREELLARVRALARRAGAGARNTIACGPVVLDLANRTAMLNGQGAALTDREFEVAAYLLQNRGRLIPRVELLRNVWRTSAALETRTVDTHVSRVRHKLQLLRTNGFRLEAVYNHGYRLEHAGDSG
jgi:two-component system, OmpR family, response regulator RegX3